MTDKPSKFLVAVAQFAPVFLDRDASLEKACELIKDAGERGARLIVFPEAFVAGYPDWVWVLPAGQKQQYQQLYSELAANAISIPDQATEQIGKAAKEAGVYVAIGVNERNSESSNASLFNTLLFIDDQGVILGRHRKLVPTGGERLIWAQGHQNSFSAYDTPLGRLGGLICWENYMPLARFALYQQGVQIYVAATWDSSETWLSSMRHIAKEAGAFVVGCCSAVHIDQIPGRCEFKRLYPEGKEWINPGNSCVVNPNGQFVAGPVAKKEEMIMAEVDLDLVPGSKWILDTAGHYSRPDVFSFSVRQ